MTPPDEIIIWHSIYTLKRPYVLSFGTLREIDSFVAMARFPNGTFGFGESCPLPGYSHETADLIADEFRKLEATANLDDFLLRNERNPFVTAPLLTSLECRPTGVVFSDVPICPVLQWTQRDELPGLLANFANNRITTVKIKVSADLGEFKQVLHVLQQVGRDLGLKFRYDANQALSLSQATEVSQWLNDATTELFEQPLPVDAWDQMASLYKISPIPLMLDESILDVDSIRRAATCADLVKLKLAKNGSVERLRTMITSARQFGLEVVLGNGVQGSLGCWLEAGVHSEFCLSLAGEMNGFRKIQNDPLAWLLVDRGESVHPAHSLSPDRIETALNRVARRIYRVVKPTLASQAA